MKELIPKGRRPAAELKQPRRRALGFVAMMAAGFAVLLLRSYFINESADGRLARLARIQHTHIIKLPGARGTILDIHGRPLALTVPVASVFAEPRQVADPAQTARLLAPLLMQPIEKLHARLKSGKAFVWLQRKVDPGVERSVAALQIPGIGLRADSIRSYPFRELTACVLGAVGIDQEPLGGIELQYNDILASPPRQLIVGRDARGEEYILEDAEPKARPRGDIVLTLDRDIQHSLEKALGRVLAGRGAKSAMGIVMDIPTGGILAMASLPCFNPNSYSEYRPELWKNRLITDPFEPGSTFKAILAAAALDSGRVRPDDSFDCGSGTLQVGHHVIHDHRPYGRLTFREILEVSSNIGATKIQQKLGARPFYETIRAFGFGTATGIDLPGESAGRLPPVDKWSPIAASNLSFGQGVSVTGLQLVSAVAAVARRGVWMAPHIVDHVIGPGGTARQVWKGGGVRSVIRPETAGILSAMMRGVVSEHGTAPLARVPGYSVAGKTGTAQKTAPGAKGYLKDKYLASFVGFIPATAPRLAILIVADEPTGNYFGGTVAAPIFQEVASEAMAALAIPPDLAPSGRPGPTPVEYRVEPAAWTPGARPERPRGDDAGKIPDLVGLSLREAASLLIQRGVAFDVEGEGFVISQGCTARESIHRVEKCLLKLAPHL